MSPEDVAGWDPDCEIHFLGGDLRPIEKVESETTTTTSSSTSASAFQFDVVNLFRLEFSEKQIAEAIQEEDVDEEEAANRKGKKKKKKAKKEEALPDIWASSPPPQEANPMDFAGRGLYTELGFVGFPVGDARPPPAGGVGEEGDGWAAAFGCSEEENEFLAAAERLGELSDDEGKGDGNREGAAADLDAEEEALRQRQQCRFIPATSAEGAAKSKEELRAKLRASIRNSRGGSCLGGFQVRPEARRLYAKAKPRTVDSILMRHVLDCLGMDGPRLLRCQPDGKKQKDVGGRGAVGVQFFLEAWAMRMRLVLSYFDEDMPQEEISEDGGLGVCVLIGEYQLEISEDWGFASQLGSQPDMM
eukprot:g8340.t1